MVGLKQLSQWASLHKTAQQVRFFLLYPVLFTANQIHTVVGEDVAIPQLLEVVFEVGQMESTSCANISVISDTELEGEEFFTFTIVSAGAEPHARIRNPSVATITIEDSTSVAGSDDQSGVLSLQWTIVIPTLCSIAIGTSCLLAAIFYRCHSKHQKTQQNLGEDPLYDDIVSNDSAYHLQGESGSSVVRNELPENIPLQTAPNEAYQANNNSPLSVVYDLAITTSWNESYANPTSNVNESSSQDHEMVQSVITTLRNEAYSGFQELPATLEENMSTTEPSTDGYLQVIP